MAPTIEIARFTVKKDEEQAFLDERDAMSEAAKATFEGLLDEMLIKMEDGSYLTIWTWQARDHCDRAMAQVDQVAAVASWLGHMDEQISMEFGLTVGAAHT